MPSEVVPYLVGTGATLMLAGFLLFFRGSNAAFKRRLYPWYAALAGLALGGFMLFTMAPALRDGTVPPGPFIAIPFVAFVVFVNIKFARFCGRCGRLAPLFAKTCPKCGEPVK